MQIGSLPSLNLLKSFDQIGKNPATAAPPSVPESVPPKSGYAVAWPTDYTPSPEQLAGIEAITAKYAGQSGPDALRALWDEIEQSGLYPADVLSESTLVNRVDQYA